MAHRLQKTNKVRHKIVIIQIDTDGSFKPIYKLEHESWSKAFAFYIGEGSFANSGYEIIESSKYCRILRSVDFPHTDSFSYFFVDVKSFTVEQAIATTNIGRVILTHNS